MSVFSAETVAGMNELGAKHGVKFGFVRQHQSPTDSEWRCLVTDAVGSLVGEGKGYDRDDAFHAASTAIDYSAIGKSPAEMASELRALRAHVGATTVMGDAIKAAESPKRRPKDFPATS